MLIAPEAWHSFAMVRPAACRPNPNANVDWRIVRSNLSSPYFRGSLDVVNESTVLSLAWHTYYDSALYDCDDLDFEEMFKSINFEVAGRQVGRAIEAKSTCPINSRDLKQQNWNESYHQLTYAIEGTYRLQTLAAEVRIKTRNGEEQRCQAAKITPDIGPSYRALFTYLPAVVMGLVAFSSWQSHLSQIGTSSLLGYASVLSSGGMAWETANDVADYLRYLQFIFLYSCLSVEYPGFFQPITGNAAWSSLMFWKGPIRKAFGHGQSPPPVDHGFYSANITYGLGNMRQTIGFPGEGVMMISIIINLLLLIAAIFIVASACCWITSKRSQVVTVVSVSLSAARYATGISLLFFSVPLLFYLSSEWLYREYFPKYRIAIVALILTAIIVTFCVLQYYLAKAAKPTDDSHRSKKAFFSRRGFFNRRALLQGLNRYLPIFVPLVQATVVNSFQWNEVAQVEALVVCEALLFIHITGTLRLNCWKSDMAWCSVARLTVAILQITFISQVSEATNQQAAYAILCVHALIIFVAFPVFAAWKLRQVRILKRTDRKKKGQSNIPPNLNMNDITSHFASNKTDKPSENDSPMSQQREGGYKIISLPDKAYSDSSRTASPCADEHDISSPVRPGLPQRGFSAFYRRPRPRSDILGSQSGSAPQSPLVSSPRLSDIGRLSHASSSAAICSDGSEAHAQDRNDRNADVQERSNVDYSLREADLYRGLVVEGSPSATLTPSLLSGDGEDNKLSRDGWTRKIQGFAQPKQKEKGFQVSRPPRPTGDLSCSVNET